MALFGMNSKRSEHQPYSQVKRGLCVKSSRANKKSEESLPGSLFFGAALRHSDECLLTKIGIRFSPVIVLQNRPSWLQQSLSTGFSLRSDSTRGIPNFIHGCFLQVSNCVRFLLVFEGALKFVLAGRPKGSRRSGWDSFPFLQW
jgi:hypothetical protein